jgi:membrane protein DedA with SNARE-associated domain/rhodanese-related sulfurtransferase
MPRALELLFAFVFLEAVGLPLPAAPALMAAGATAATGRFPFAFAWTIAFAALFLGDILLFAIGRRTGWWFLSLLCRLSANPENCIFSNAARFHRHGRKALLFAKFFPGVNTMAAPLAGSMNMPLRLFLTWDIGGALLYSGFYLGLGYLASPIITRVISQYENAGRLLTWTLFLVVLAYAAFRLAMNWGVRSIPVSAALPAELAARLKSGDDLLIVDVRSHGYYDEKAQRISGAIRLEPNSLPASLAELPRDKDIYVYCTCQADATSRRVGQLLERAGFRAKVLSGGLSAWKRDGHPLEPVPSSDIIKLPSFR